MKLPRVRPVEIRKDGKDFHLCKDERSGSSLDNPAGGLFIFWKHEDSTSKVAKNTAKMLRYGKRKAISSNLVQSGAFTGLENG